MSGVPLGESLIIDFSEDASTDTVPQATAPLPPGVLPPGTRLGSYVLEDCIGTGGFARVYSARQETLGRKVAIKVLHGAQSKSKELVQRFVREAQIVNKVRHPAIVDVFDLGTTSEGRPFFVMDLLVGRSLSAVIREVGYFKPAEAVRYLEPVVSALTAAHAHGVVHRDVKASNILVMGGGPSLEVKLLDFGIAKLLQPESGDAQLTTEQQCLGSALSMAPEQILGQRVDARTDVYGLGVLLYLMLCGCHPFEGNFHRIVEGHLNRPPPPPPLPLSGAVHAVLLRALAKDPRERFSTAASLLAALKEAAMVLAPATSRTLSGLGLLVRCIPPEGVDDEERWLFDASRALDAMLAEATRARFRNSFQTADSLLVVSLLADDDAERKLQLEAARTLAAALHHRARESLGDGGLLSVLVNVDSLEVRLSSSGAVPTGGRLVDPTTWPPATEGVDLTPSAWATLR